MPQSLAEIFIAGTLATLKADQTLVTTGSCSTASSGKSRLPENPARGSGEFLRQSASAIRLDLIYHYQMTHA